MDTFRAQSITLACESDAEKKGAPVRAGLRGQKTRGLPLGHQGHSQRPAEPFECPLAQRVTVSGGDARLPAEPKEKAKNRAFSAHVSWFDRVCLAPHVPKKTQVELCV